MLFLSFNGYNQKTKMKEEILSKMTDDELVIDLLWKKDFDIEHINYVLNIFINKVTQEYNAGN